MRGIRKNGEISKWFVLGCAFIFFFTTFMYAFLHQAKAVTAVGGARNVYVAVKPGMDAARIAEILYEKDVIDSVTGFRFLAKLNGLDDSLRAGNYAFNAKMSYRDIIGILARGETSAIRVMVPEGYSVRQLAKLLEEKGVAKASEVEAIAKDFAPYEYMTASPDSAYRAEGFLFPDTYEIAAGQSAEEILLLMAKTFDRRFTPDMRDRMEAMGLTMREVVTLASLVEREAQADEDRPIIAQVFLNRIRMYMPLQSCATIQYILGSPKAELSVQDTQIESPYNTYQHMGLPPGPISNPGLASLQSVLYSKPTEFLYFVADKNGKHHFSKTYEEHLREIDRIG